MMNLPEWAPSLALFLLIVGLPIVLATAFVQEGVGGRAIENQEAAEPTESSRSVSVSNAGAPRRLLTWRNAILGGGAAGLVWSGIAVGYLLFGRDAAPAGVTEKAGSAMRSVAVLPFASRSTVAEDTFFVQGIHDDILSQLAKVKALTVISRTSVMQYAGTKKSIREIASELGVATVLEGGVQRAGSRVRINAQLIDAKTDAHLWAETYDKALTTENIFAIQSEIALAIARALEARLTPAEQARVGSRPTKSLEAYDLFNEARYLEGGGTIEMQSRAIDVYREATRLDPEFAAAYAGFAKANLGRTNMMEASKNEAVAAAKPAVERALALDPNLADAHIARGMLLELEFDFDAAEQAYQRGIELNPGGAEPHSVLGRMYLLRSRIDEASRELQRAAELDPLNLTVRIRLAYIELFARRFGPAVAQARRALQLDPQSSIGHYYLGYALSLPEKHEDASAAANRARQLEPENLTLLIMLGFVHARAGHRTQAIEVASDVERRGGSLKEIALVYAQLGEVDRAFDYRERAYVREPIEMANLEVDPSADPLRADPRFDALLRKAGLK
jgi:TolB-like protein/Flp pilus assembly protein TadD